MNNAFGVSEQEFPLGRTGSVRPSRSSDMRTCQSRRKSAETPLSDKTPKPSFYSPFFYSPFALLQCQKESWRLWNKMGPPEAPNRLHQKPWNLHEVDSECVDAVGEAAKLCEDLGHHVEEASPEIDEAALTKAIWIIIIAQTRALLQFAALVLGRQATLEDVEPVTWAWSEDARRFSASDYAEAITAVHRTGRVVGRFFTGYDILMTPTMCTPPHKLGEVSMMRTDIEAFRDIVLGDSAFNRLFNASGNPAMSVPLHWSAEGLPVGVQFAAPFGDEATLFRLAGQLETAQPWANRRPAQTY